MADKEINDPSTTSMAYDVMQSRWNKVDTVLSGTDAMRYAAQEFLPQHREEADATYGERLARNVLLNMTELTLDSWVGRPFSDLVKFSEEIPEHVVDLMEDVDLQGNNVTVFARQWFKEGLAKGFAHVLIDFPRVQYEVNGEGGLTPRTMADDRRDNLRPYWSLVKPENVIFAHAEIIDGVEVLTHVRIREEIVEQVGYAEVIKQRIRVIEPGIQQVFELQKTTKKKKEEWVLIEEFGYDLDIIPLVTFYANREGFMIAKPPLSDLADLNIAHWQSSSDQRAVLTVARFPILAVSGATDEEGKLTIGPNNFLSTPDARGKFYYVEHSGKAIEAGRQDLIDLQEQMGNYGAEFLKKRPGNTTATARALDSSEAVSPLQDMVIRFEDALNLAKAYTSKWLGEDDIGRFEVHKEFGPEEIISADLTALSKARETRDISRMTFLVELQRRGVINDDVDLEEDAEQLEQEMLAFAAMAGTELDPDQEDKEEKENEDD